MKRPVRQIRLINKKKDRIAIICLYKFGDEYKFTNQKYVFSNNRFIETKEVESKNSEAAYNLYSEAVKFYKMAGFKIESEVENVSRALEFFKDW